MATNFALLVARLALAAVMGAHGLQHCFGIFDGPEPKGMLAFQTSLVGWGIPSDKVFGIQAQQIVGWLVGAAELGGAALIAVGFLARYCAFWHVVVLGGAVVLVHGGSGFFLPWGMEFVGSLLALAIVVLFLGPGGWALKPGRSR